MKNSFIFIILTISFYNEANVEAEAHTLLLHNYHKSINELSLNKCGNKVSPVLPADLFKGINLTKSQISKVLVFHHDQAYLKCTKLLRYEYLLNATLLRLQDKSNKTQKMIAESDNLLTFAYRLYLESKIEYMKLSPKLRKKVEQLPELQHPFEPMLSSELLEKNNEYIVNGKR